MRQSSGGVIIDSLDTRVAFVLDGEKFRAVGLARMHDDDRENTRRVVGGGLMCLAIPGQVVELVDEEKRLATVEVAGVRRNVNIGLLDDSGDTAPGDWVLIHVGFAMSRVDEQEAQATLRLLRSMGEAYEQELEDLKTSVIE